MAKNIYVDGFCGTIIAALADDKRLLEYHIEKYGTVAITGSIYMGRVENVLDGMEAAFVDVGLEKNGYLSFSDPTYGCGDDDSACVDQKPFEYKKGDKILVQAIKDPFGSKGVRLSTTLSFAGRFLVYAPEAVENVFSRKIESEKEKKRLEGIISSLKIPGGFILRTASDGASKGDLVSEAKYLYNLYKDMLVKIPSAKPGDVLYSEGNLAVRMLRDVYTSEIEKIYVSDEQIYKDLRENAAKRGAEVLNKVVYFDKRVDMFGYFGLSDEVDALLRNKVDLSSGAYLVIDRTEALTAIDVNTGSFTGSGNLEETVFHTNLLAAKEIARQVRLRNIGGIIIVDFINMDMQEHRDAVVNELTEALKADRAKCTVLGMNQLGLVEFTRKKKRKESISLLEKKCPYCQGDGAILSNDYIVLKIRAALLDVFADGYKSAIVDLNIEIMFYILQRGSLRKDVSRIWADKRIYIVPHKTYHHEFFTVRGDDSVVLDLPDKARILY